MSTPEGSRFSQFPRSAVGRWAFGLAAGNILLNFINPLLRLLLANQMTNPNIMLPSSGFLMLILGLVGGVLGVIALVRKHEKSWAVWLTLLVGASMVFLLLGEFLLPH
jgi:hypothetical protein